MALLIKNFESRGLSVSVQKVSREDKLLLSGDGNHRGGYMVTCGDSNESRIRLIYAKAFNHKPTRNQVESTIIAGLAARDKMDAKDGVEETLNLLQEAGFKPESNF